HVHAGACLVSRARRLSPHLLAAASRSRPAAREAGRGSPLGAAQPERANCSLSAHRPGKALRQAAPKRLTAFRVPAQGSVLRVQEPPRGGFCLSSRSLWSSRFPATINETARVALV